MANHDMDPEKFRGTMHSLAYGTAMAAAARDYQKEMLEAEKAQKVNYRAVDMEDLMDDPELEKIHAERLAKLKEEQEKRQEMQRKGHGEYEEVEEGDFLEVVTKTPKVVVQFFHRDFERCKILDKHMQVLCKKYFDTRFIKISAPDAPFFTVKLKVQMLPCILMFIDGICCDRVVGFEELGATDHFKTEVLEKRLLSAHVIKPRERTEDDSDEEEELEQIRRSIRARQVRDEDDESSDFSD